MLLTHTEFCEGGYLLKQKAQSFFIIAILAIIGTVGFYGDKVEASQSELKQVTIIDYSDKQSVSTNSLNIRGLLSELGISLGEYDKISHPLNSILKNGMNIYIKRVEKKEISAVEAMPYEKIYVASDKKPNSVIEKGENGEKQVVYEVTYTNGKETDRKVLSSVVTKKSVPCVLSCGEKQSFREIKKNKKVKSSQTSRAMSFAHRKVMNMRATAYAAEDFKHSRTATGTRAVRGVVAVDPRVIPLGTKLYIEGYGYAVAADTGSAIKGNIIDLCMTTRKECKKWGRKKVKVYILN